MAFPPSHHDAFMFQSLHEYPTDPSSIPFLPSCPPHFSHDGDSVMKRSMSFSSRAEQGISNRTSHHHNDQELLEEDLSDDGSLQMLGEKKKRLNHEQVKALEKSFELRNKLEPETKVQLARALGLQPRQVAIWFQNRRARWKTKQLERDYEVLKKQFSSLKADNDALLAHNRKLNAQLVALKNNSWESSKEVQMKKEREQGSWSDNSNSDNINLNMSRNSPMSKQFMVNNQDENFCSILTGIDEQQQGWAWLDHNLHLH